MMAKRRASAIRALRIVDRLAIANAQSLSFKPGFVARQHNRPEAGFRRWESNHLGNITILPAQSDAFDRAKSH
jgi:hypothetical protein